MALTHTDVVNRLGKLLAVIEWVGSDVTASFDEKLQANRDSEYVSQQIIGRNSAGSVWPISQVVMVNMNTLWQHYTGNLTGSNVPKKIRRLVDDNRQ